MKKTWIFAVLAAMAMGLAVFGCSNGDSSSESVRDFGKGTYKLDGTFENGTIHLHQTPHVKRKWMGRTCRRYTPCCKRWKIHGRHG